MIILALVGIEVKFKKAMWFTAFLVYIFPYFFFVFAFIFTVFFFDSWAFGMVIFSTPSVASALALSPRTCAGSEIDR